MQIQYSGCDVTCPVGEGLTEKVEGGGLCNSNPSFPVGDKKCQDHCQKQYGNELCSSRCSDVRANQQRECICSLSKITKNCIIKRFA